MRTTQRIYNMEVALNLINLFGRFCWYGHRSIEHNNASNSASDLLKAQILKNSSEHCSTFVKEYSKYLPQILEENLYTTEYEVEALNKLVKIINSDKFFLNHQGEYAFFTNCIDENIYSEILVKLMEEIQFCINTFQDVFSSNNKPSHIWYSILYRISNYNYEYYCDKMKTAIMQMNKINKKVIFNN